MEIIPVLVPAPIKLLTNTQMNAKANAKAVLFFIRKAIENAKVTFNFKERESEDSEEELEELVQFVHLLIRTYPRIKLRNSLEPEDYYLSIEQLLIDSKLVKMSFIYQLCFQYNIRFTTENIIIMVDSVKASTNQEKILLFAEVYTNDVIHHNDEQMCSYIVKTFEYSMVIIMCSKVLADIDNFAQVNYVC